MLRVPSNCLREKNKPSSALKMQREVMNLESCYYVFPLALGFTSPVPDVLFCARLGTEGCPESDERQWIFHALLGAEGNLFRKFLPNRLSGIPEHSIAPYFYSPPPASPLATSENRAQPGCGGLTPSHPANHPDIGDSKAHPPPIPSGTRPGEVGNSGRWSPKTRNRCGRVVFFSLISVGFTSVFPSSLSSEPIGHLTGRLDEKQPQSEKGIKKN
ncbi:hypothetical protein JRQ81_009300 [Phrynocephalus forsythii]|uniref:Uncharacterized protein n=1 Tax=Phrynocephalus forsythii TaxID=171643 RepID=A0A9Q1AS53_9SAUR|nr:hypothetical protein JRQ81_009300 [Phrynocephalus forsythii]